MRDGEGGKRAAEGRRDGAGDGRASHLCDRWATMLSFAGRLPMFGEGGVSVDLDLLSTSEVVRQLASARAWDRAKEGRGTTHLIVADRNGART